MLIAHTVHVSSPSPTHHQSWSSYHGSSTHQGWTLPLAMSGQPAPEHPPGIPHRDASSCPGWCTCNHTIAVPLQASPPCVSLHHQVLDTLPAADGSQHTHPMDSCHRHQPHLHTCCQRTSHTPRKHVLPAAAAHAASAPCCATAAVSPWLPVGWTAAAAPLLQRVMTGKGSSANRAPTLLHLILFGEPPFTSRWDLSTSCSAAGPWAWGKGGQVSGWR